MLRSCAIATLALLACVGCSTASSAPSPSDAAVPDATALLDAAAIDAAADAPPPPPDGAAIIAARPYTLHVPASYDPATPAPLVVMFHGFGYSGTAEEAYLRFSLASDAHGFLYAYGDGTTDPDGNTFWNATDGCCDFYHSGVDDVAYFDAIVEDVAATHNVDRKRIYVMGHSNGGFMSHRLACDRANVVAAILSLAGAQWNDAARCTPSEPVAIVELHGDMDMTISYDGGASAKFPSFVYPSARTTVATWASKDGCTGTLAPTGATLDLDQLIAGNETVVAAYGGCPAGIDVELWTIQGGQHIPSINHTPFFDAVWGFFAAHPKP